MPYVSKCLYSFDRGYLQKKGRFLDSLRVFVKGGCGGQGLEKYGGVGGDGGNVYFVADQLQNLLKLYQSNTKCQFTAGVGEVSSKRRLLGQAGSDAVVSVPVGVAVKSDSGRELGDLNKDGQKVLVARGGMGGNPDNRYIGHKGENRSLILDLKLIADVGLLGFPNAGKSTFLSNISKASPKVSEYPFTTIRPQLGIMDFPDHRQISVADLPGLIEGAHVNIGLGHTFLKHVERTKLLLFFVDVHGFQLGHKWPRRTAFETAMLLNKELELYKAHLVDKPAILAVNKVDTDEDMTSAHRLIDQIQRLPESLLELAREFRPDQLVHFDSVVPISAKYGHHLPGLRECIRQTLDFYADLKMAATSGELTVADGDRQLRREINRTNLV